MLYSTLYIYIIYGIVNVNQLCTELTLNGTIYITLCRSKRVCKVYWAMPGLRNAQRDEAVDVEAEHGQLRCRHECLRQRAAVGGVI